MLEIIFSHTTITIILLVAFILHFLSTTAWNKERLERIHTRAHEDYFRAECLKILGNDHVFLNQIYEKIPNYRRIYFFLIDQALNDILNDLNNKGSDKGTYQSHGSPLKEALSFFGLKELPDNQNELKSVYRKLVKKYHPDINPHLGHDSISILNKHYEFLKSQY